VATYGSFLPPPAKTISWSTYFLCTFFFFRVLGKRSSKTDSPWSTWFKDKKGVVLILDFQRQESELT